MKNNFKKIDQKIRREFYSKYKNFFPLGCFDTMKFSDYVPIIFPVTFVIAFCVSVFSMLIVDEEYSSGFNFLVIVLAIFFLVLLSFYFICKLHNYIKNKSFMKNSFEERVLSEFREYINNNYNYRINRYEENKDIYCILKSNNDFYSYQIYRDIQKNKIIFCLDYIREHEKMSKLSSSITDLEGDMKNTEEQDLVNIIKEKIELKKLEKDLFMEKLNKIFDIIKELEKNEFEICMKVEKEALEKEKNNFKNSNKLQENYLKEMNFLTETLNQFRDKNEASASTKEKFS